MSDDDDRRECFDFMVILDKEEYGLGIYFTISEEGTVIVDKDVPFYRFPKGRVGPGEKSRVIHPGDTLVTINTTKVSTLDFDQVIQHLRKIPLGPNELYFKSTSSTTTTITTLEKENVDTKNNSSDNNHLAAALKKEKQCRKLVENKCSLYIDEISKLQEDLLRTNAAKDDVERKLNMYQKLIETMDIAI